MLKRIGSLLVIVVVLLVTGAINSAQAQTDTGPVWEAAYWNNPNLVGEPTVERLEPAIDHRWGLASPATQIEPDTFSARWTRTVALPAGLYRFRMIVDDGGRLWVNNQLLIDAWEVQAVNEFVEDLYLLEGPVSIEMQYFDAQGAATAQLEWERVTSTTNTWRAEYYSNPFLRGEPVEVRQDAFINFNWGDGAPVFDEPIGQIGLEPDRFSVRWQRTLNLPADTYRFEMTVDDGGRLFVNGRRLIDAWQVQATDTFAAEVRLPGGPTTIEMEYFENTGEATAQLNWTPVSEQPLITREWRGDYYTNASLRGNPADVRRDIHIDFDWQTQSPNLPIIDPDNFSVRWRKTVDLPAGQYCFAMRVDDGGRLLVNSQPIINAWTRQAPTTYVRKIEIPAGATSLEMEYYENSGLAIAQLGWARIDPSAATPTLAIRASQVGYIPDNLRARPEIWEECLQQPLVAVRS